MNFQAAKYTARRTAVSRTLGAPSPPDLDRLDRMRPSKQRTEVKNHCRLSLHPHHPLMMMLRGHTKVRVKVIPKLCQKNVGIWPKLLNKNVYKSCLCSDNNGQNSLRFVKCSQTDGLQCSVLCTVDHQIFLPTQVPTGLTRFQGVTRFKLVALQVDPQRCRRVGTPGI